MADAFDNLVEEIPIQLIISGYVLDRNILNKVDLAVQRVFSNLDNFTKDTLQLICTVSTFPDKKHNITEKILKFNSVNDLLNYFDAEPLSIKSILLEYIFPPKASISINLGHEGIIKGSAIGSGRYFSHDVYYSLIRELEFCEQSYDWIERNLLREAKVPWGILSFSSLIMVLSVISNFVFRAPQLTPEMSNRLMNHVDELKLALTSDSIKQKLDAIIISLIQQSNSSITIDTHLFSYKILVVAGLLLATSILFILTSKKRKELYPKAFFNIGRNQIKFEQINKDRDFWKNTVIVSFILNIIASVVIALVM